MKLQMAATWGDQIMLNISAQPTPGLEMAIAETNPRPDTMHTACAALGYRRGDFPMTESAAERTRFLPISAQLRRAEISYVPAPLGEAESESAQAGAQARACVAGS